MKISQTVFKLQTGHVYVVEIAIFNVLSFYPSWLAQSYLRVTGNHEVAGSSLRSAHVSVENYFLLPLIQVGQLSVDGRKMGT